MHDRIEMLGPHEILDVLGRGGMGVVYLAKRAGVEGRAALKTATSTETMILAQLRREIYTLARLEHPGIVRLLDHGMHDGTPWYAMELIEGATLSEVLRANWAPPGPTVSGKSSIRAVPPAPLHAATAATLATYGRLSSMVVAARAAEDESASSALADGIAARESDEALAVPSDGPRPPAAGGQLGRSLGLLRRICDALAFIHGQGIIHRDLKPGNIFVRDDGRPVLVDFGLAALVGGVTGREVVGVDGHVAGSLPYMAPEQIRGQVLDARCDLYALGCLLYETLTGRPPFLGGAAAIVHGHFDVDATPPSALVSGVPDELDQLVASLLEKQRDRRMGYAVDVAAALDAIGCTAPSWTVPLPPAQPYLYRPPFIGRESLFETLRRRLNDLAGGLGGLLLVGGESGVGKTRLVLEAAAAARRSSMVVIAGECGASSTAATYSGLARGAPLSPLVGLLEAAVDRCVNLGSDALESFVLRFGALLARYCPAIAALDGIGDLPPPPELPPAAARARLYRTLTDLLADYVSDQPALLVLDDVQWADELTLGFIEHVATLGAAAPPALLIGTYRSGECGARVRALADHEAVPDLRVERMNASEVGRMVSGMLAYADPPPAFVEFLARHSEGNPFFVAEYLRTAVAEHVLVRTRAGRWTVAQTETPTEEMCEALPLPRSLRQVVELRLGRLSLAARGVLETAAVIGRRIDVDALRVVGDLDEPSTIAVLDEMLRGLVIEPVEAGGYRFVHDKLREVALADLSASRRQTLHRQAAAGMERHFGTSVSDGTEGADNGVPGGARHAAIGEHWAAGGEPARAVPYLETAGDRARAFHAVDESIALYRMASEQLEHAAVAAPDGRDWRALRLSLAERLGDVLTFASHHEKAIDGYQQALSHTLDDERLIAVRVRRKMGKTYETLHDHERSLEAYAGAEALVGDDPRAVAEELGREWVRIQLGRAYVHYWRGDPAAARKAIDRVSPHVGTLGAAIDRYGYYHQLVNWQFRQGRYRITDETLLFCRSALDAARAADSLPEIAFARFMLGFALLFKGDLSDAEIELGEALEASRRIGDTVGETRVGAYLALTLRRAKRTEEVRVAALETLELARARSMLDYVGVAQACLGWVDYVDGKREEAAASCRAALDTWDGLSFPHPFRWNAALTLMDLTLDAGDLADVIQLARELVMPTQQQLPDEIDEPLVAAVAAFDADDHPGAETWLDEALVAAERLRYV